MALITITINTDNAAFRDEHHHDWYAADMETAAILRRLAKQFKQNEIVDRVLDSNGNTVGRVEYSQ